MSIVRSGLPAALTVAMMDTCWVSAWALLFGLWQAFDRGDPLLPTPSVFLLLMGGWAVARVLGRVEARRLRAPIAVGLGTAAALTAAWGAHGVPTLAGISWILLPRLLFTPTAATWAFLLALALWRGGLVYGQGRIDFDELDSAFRRGLVALVLFVPTAAGTLPSAYATLQTRAVVSAIVFFFVAFSALALARLAAIRRARQAGEAAPPLDRGWLGVMLGVIAGLLLATVAVSLLFSLDLIALVLATILRPILVVLAGIMLLIAFPIAYVLAYVVVWIRQMMVARGGLFGGQSGLQALLDQLRQPRERVEPSDELVLASEWLVFVAIAIVLALVLAGALRWWRDRQAAEEADEERESVWSWGELGAALRAWLRRLLGRGRPGTMSPTPLLTYDVAAPGQLGIRELYRRLLALGSARGRSRRPAATPLEHMPALQGVLNPRGDVEALTEAYQAARYGPDDPSAAAVAEARERWARVQAATTAMESDA
jgi:hypothetical protein